MINKFIFIKNINMYIGIVGSRDYFDYEYFCKKLKKTNFEGATIVSGGASGVDRMAEKYSREILNKEPIIFKANWKLYGKKAGPIRNKEIVNKSDYIIAFQKN